MTDPNLQLDGRTLTNLLEWMALVQFALTTRFAAANLCVSAAAIFPVQG